MKALRPTNIFVFLFFNCQLNKFVLNLTVLSIIDSGSLLSIFFIFFEFAFFAPRWNIKSGFIESKYSKLDFESDKSIIL